MTIVPDVAWRKSSRSGPNGACVEIANDGHHAAARDSKNPDGPILTLTPNTLHTFVSHIRTT